MPEVVTAIALIVLLDVGLVQTIFPDGSYFFTKVVYAA